METGAQALQLIVDLAPSGLERIGERRVNAPQLLL